MGSRPKDIERLKERKKVSKLIKLLKDEDISKQVAEALVEIGRPAVLPLIGSLQDPFVGGSVMWILGEIRDERAIMPLISLLVRKRELNIFRRAVAMVLVKIGGASVELLIDALNSELMLVRKEVIQALGEIADSRATEPLIKILANDEFSSVRKRAATALGNIGDQKAIDALKQAVTQEQDGAVKNEIDKVLKNLKK